MFLRLSNLMVRSAPLLTIFSMHLDILSKYWHCLLRNLRTDRGSQADKLKNTSAWHKRYNGAPPGRSQAALSVPLLRQACCLWKCSLVCCPYVRRDSNKLKALWFPRLKKELACVLRGQRQRPPNSWFFFFLVRLDQSLNQTRSAHALTPIYCLYPGPS